MRHHHGCRRLAGHDFPHHSEAGFGRRHHHPHGPHRGFRRGGRHGRLFDYGELRTLVLAMIAEQPRHGYELIKAIEERFGGSYAPSPGVIYPTLSWLDDMGYAAVEPVEGGRKRYRITPEGEAFLAQNREAADELLARAAGAEGEAVPASVIRGMENLKMALRLRLRRGGLDAEAAAKVAAALDAAAQEVERT